ADEAKQIRPMKAAFDPNFITRLNGTWCKEGRSKWDLMEQLRADIRSFRQENRCDRVVVIWAASTEAYLPMSDVHEDLAKFEAEMKNPDTRLVAPSMCYAYAAMMEGAPFINGAPALTVDFPAMWQLADKMNIPICGKDYKSGQTMMKTVLAPAFHTRMLGLAGWFSTNILGNRDGEVLDDPASFKTKEVSKLSVIDSILEPEKYPDLYSDVYHKVRINYYPPRNDNKEAWDNIDIFGWMGYPMQIKVNFLCRDSILAAPLALDLVLLSDLAKRCGFKGIQRWLSFYFKSPMHELDEVPVHSLFEQDAMFRDKLREIIGEE
ncbi:MAG: inositol-3-phosphate synthase, partial [Eggerthellaceae bacterium]|nr:inositol-3-phosphate synthase [Eggerthellaceae bacterium]